MPFYVDPLCAHGMKIRGTSVLSCHLFTDGGTLDLISFGHKIGLKPRWLDKRNRIIHFDLTESMRRRAIAAGAIPLSREESVRIWRMIREGKIASADGCLICTGKEDLGSDRLCSRCKGRKEETRKPAAVQQESLF